VSTPVTSRPGAEAGPPPPHPPRAKHFSGLPCKTF